MSSNHISTVRQHLLDQMQALREAKDPEAVKTELERAKGISELAQVAVNSAKVEVEYLKVTDQTNTPFLDRPATERQAGDGAPLPNGIVGITRHSLGA
jgi:hypothetical protein